MLRYRDVVRAFLLVLVLGPAAVTQAPVRTHPIEAEDYFSLGVITDIAPSPDGRVVAWSELRWDRPTDRRNGDLWVVEVDSGKPRRLTFDPAADRSPEWAPDSDALYFLSGRRRAGESAPPFDGKTQVWRVSVHGGVPEAITRVPGGVEDFHLAGNGRSLYYTRSRQQVADEFKDLRTRFASLEYGHGVETFHTMWRLDLVTWREAELVDPGRFVRYFAVAPDERRIAMITDPTEHLITHEGWSRVDVWDADTKAVTTLGDDLWRKEAPSPFGWLAGFAWSADSRALAFNVDFDGYPAELFVAEWEGTTAKVFKVPRPQEVHLESEKYAWQGASRNLCFLGHRRAVVQVHCVANVTAAGCGPAHVLSPADKVVSDFGFDGDGGSLFAAWSDTSNPGDVFQVNGPDEYRRLTAINPQVDTWKLPRISRVTWKGAGGDDVEGILELPADWKEGQPLPLVVELHGGPTAATYYHMRFWIYGRTLLPAKGYALLSPNYRGSLGYGDRFVTDLVGRENDIEVEDILKGVDHLVAQGIADPERLGVIGWSNGGLLTNCLISKSPRFKAASSGAGNFDAVLQWCEEDTPGHVVNFMGGRLPWEAPEEYRKASPLYFMAGVRTPTLIHVGGNDPRVPPGHSRGLYRALRHYLGVPTELVVYPGAGHSLTTYQHRLAKMKWDLAWFARWLPVD